MRFEAMIKAPAGTTLNVEKIASQKSDDGLQILSGGGDQVLLPENWDLGWVNQIIDSGTGAKYTLTRIIHLMDFECLILNFRWCRTSL